MVLLRNFINIFYITELRKKLLFTLGILVVYRIGNHIPVIGLNLEKLHEMVTQRTMLGGFFSFLDSYTGGSLAQGMLFGLGIAPFITASIMMQMLTLSIPSLEQLAKEGEYGKKIINQYTRYLTFGVSMMQSLGIAIFLEQKGLALEPGWSFRLLLILSLTVGSMFVMWLGEQISMFGVGNGSSMIIFAGIVSRIPAELFSTIGAIQQGIFDPVKAFIVLGMLIFITACIVFLERGDRKIPVQYTRRVVGQRMYAGQSTYIPFKINTAGVMPVIFASAVLNVPMFLSNLLASRWEGFKWLYDAMSRGGLAFNVLDFILIIFFSFFYTAIQYNPEELAENLKKSGGFIPGIRPGKKTAEFFNYLLTRIGLVGAIYLGVLAIMPNILQVVLNLPFYLSTLSGTGMLIMVGVALETASQIEAYLIEHRYEGFLSSGRFRGRGAR